MALKTFFQLLIAGALMLSAVVQAQEKKPAPPTTPNLLHVYNAFLDAFARDTAAWKTDIRLGASVNAKPPVPYHLQYSDVWGYFTFRAKTWNELSDYERFAVKNDPRLPHFVRQRFARTQGRTKSGANQGFYSSALPVETFDPQFPMLERSAAPASNEPMFNALSPEQQLDFASQDLEQMLANTKVLLSQASLLENRIGQRGLLYRDGKSPDTLAYCFNHTELIGTAPIRLTEIP